MTDIPSYYRFKWEETNISFIFIIIYYLNASFIILYINILIIYIIKSYTNSTL